MVHFHQFMALFSCVAPSPVIFNFELHIMVGERVEHAIFACALSPSDEMWLLICGGERARNSITNSSRVGEVCF